MNQIHITPFLKINLVPLKEPKKREIKPIFGTDPGKERSHTYRAVIPVTIAVTKNYVRNVNG